MHILRLVGRFALMAALTFVVGFTAIRIYQWILVAQETMAHNEARAAETEKNRSRLTNALTNAGVASAMAESGFWYTYTDTEGNQSVFYYDPTLWSMQQNLSDEQIKELLQRVGSSTLAIRDEMREVPANELPPQLQFHNELYSDRQPGEYQSMQGKLEAAYKRGDATEEQLWELSYMYELQGDYAKRDQVNATSCTKYKARCADQIDIKIIGKVIDLAGRPIQDAKVTVLSKTGASAVTDEKGAYAIKLAVKPMEKVRVSAVKRNFSDGSASIIVLDAGKKTYVADALVLGSPITIVTLDTEKHTVTDAKDTANPDGSFVVKGDLSTYEIPQGAIVHFDGTPYKGKVDVYVYEFSRATVPQSLTTLDTFDQAMGYAGDLMLTFGMPYIQFFAPNGEELHVKSSKPMVLTYTMAGFGLLRENKDNLPQGPLTVAQVDKLLSVSHEDGYPITREFLIANKIYTFPPFWAFDRKKGVWENIGIKLLDEKGTIQALFYTIH